MSEERPKLPRRVLECLYNAFSGDSMTVTKIEEITTNFAALAKSKTAQECAECLVSLFLNLMLKGIQKITLPITEEEHREAHKNYRNYGLDVHDVLCPLFREGSSRDSRCYVYYPHAATWEIPMLWHRRDSMPELSKWLPLMPDILNKLFMQYRKATNATGNAEAAELLRTYPISFQISVVARLRLKFLYTRDRSLGFPPESLSSLYSFRPGWGEPWPYPRIGIVKIIDNQIQIYTIPIRFHTWRPGRTVKNLRVKIFLTICNSIWNGENSTHSGDSCWYNKDSVKTWSVDASRDGSLHGLPEAHDIVAMSEDMDPSSPGIKKAITYMVHMEEHWLFRPLDISDVLGVGPFDVNYWFRFKYDDLEILSEIWGVRDAFLIPYHQVDRFKQLCRSPEVMGKPFVTRGLNKLDSFFDPYLFRVLRRGFDYDLSRQESTPIRILRP
ncbi:hypothetical protein F5Y10DRAFT_292331 [Nemania abortiva]|nr:hypothetical protein F5Y10DRAFT_292331 [Nemania abortiva]